MLFIMPAVWDCPITVAVGTVICVGSFNYEGMVSDELGFCREGRLLGGLSELAAVGCAMSQNERMVRGLLSGCPSCGLVAAAGHIRLTAGEVRKTVRLVPTGSLPSVYRALAEWQPALCRDLLMRENRAVGLLSNPQVWSGSDPGVVLDFLVARRWWPPLTGLLLRTGAVTEEVGEQVLGSVVSASSPPSAVSAAAIVESCGLPAPEWLVADVSEVLSRNWAGSVHEAELPARQRSWLFSWLIKQYCSFPDPVGVLPSNPVTRYLHLVVPNLSPEVAEVVNRNVRRWWRSVPSRYRPQLLVNPTLGSAAEKLRGSSYSESRVSQAQRFLWDRRVQWRQVFWESAGLEAVFPDWGEVVRWLEGWNRLEREGWAWRLPGWLKEPDLEWTGVRTHSKQGRFALSVPYSKRFAAPVSFRNVVPVVGEQGWDMFVVMLHKVGWGAAFPLLGVPEPSGVSERVVSLCGCPGSVDDA